MYSRRTMHIYTVLSLCRVRYSSKRNLGRLFEFYKVRKQALQKWLHFCPTSKTWFTVQLRLIRYLLMSIFPSMHYWLDHKLRRSNAITFREANLDYDPDTVHVSQGIFMKVMATIKLSWSNNDYSESCWQWRGGYSVQSADLRVTLTFSISCKCNLKVC